MRWRLTTAEERKFYWLVVQAVHVLDGNWARIRVSLDALPPNRKRNSSVSLAGDGFLWVAREKDLKVIAYGETFLRTKIEGGKLWVEEELAKEEFQSDG